MTENQRTSTEPYKGVRDFYPPDQFVQKYLFETMARACERFGYEEYTASLLEPAELYRAKTSEEIVNEQTYTFTDRGDREVTLRPEMTPTVARMVAARKRELAFPLRWYTIANVFRYERPQRGRLREHWQLNADIFGVAGPRAEVEIIALAHRIMTDLGAKENDFEIRMSNRNILNAAYDELDLAEDVRRAVTRLLDRRDKIDDFESQLNDLLGEKSGAFLAHMEKAGTNAGLQALLSELASLGVKNTSIDTSIVRGFDYYTGMVFEVYDTSSENTRSIFGGGRYDDLLEKFGAEPTPAVGFGMGDVTTRDFLETHDLLPSYSPATDLIIAPLEEATMSHATRLAQELRSEDVTVAVNFSLKRPGDQIRYAEKLGVPFVLFVGEKELAAGTYTLKHLGTGTETLLAADRIADHLLSSAG